MNTTKKCSCGEIAILRLGIRHWQHSRRSFFYECPLCGKRTVDDETNWFFFHEAVMDHYERLNPDAAHNLATLLHQLTRKIKPPRVCWQFRASEYTCKTAFGCTPEKIKRIPLVIENTIPDGIILVDVVERSKARLESVVEIDLYERGEQTK